MNHHHALTRFSQHPVAANILMLIMILIGIGAVLRMNVQFLPYFSLNNIQVSIDWPGANAEDFTRVITGPLEQNFKQIDGIKRITSTNQSGTCKMMLEFDEETNLIQAQDKVKQSINQADLLPSDAKSPRITIIDHVELIGKILVSHSGSRNALRPQVQRYEKELRDLGFAKVTVSGIPKQELEIAIPGHQLQSFKLSLPEIGQLIQAQSHYQSMGEVGQNNLGKTLKSQHDARSVDAFKNLIISNRNHANQLETLGQIHLHDKRYEPKIWHNGDHAATIALYRAPNQSALASANKLHQWLDDKKQQSPHLSLTPYFESWQLIKERIQLLLNNGTWGLAFILLVLFLMLQKRVAIWVAVGIPTSFLAGLGALYFSGGTVNMVSLFAIIMTLGIIVDDTIVVGEEILSQLQRKVPLLQAINDGTKAMLAPIIASSLTTVAAFLPLMMIGGNMGQILFDIPLVVICVIIASLVECFFVLPGHLYHSLKLDEANGTIAHQAPLHRYFVQFREGLFSRLSDWALEYRAVVLAGALGLFIISLGLITSQRIPFTFFPSTDGTKIEAQVSFLPGTPLPVLENYLTKLQDSLEITNQQLNGKEPLTQLSISRIHQQGINQVRQGANLVSVVAELSQPDQRSVTNQQFIDTWRKQLPKHPNIKKYSVLAPRGGPPGKDLDIAIRGSSLAQLKKAAHQLKNTLQQLPGVFNVQDDFPEGQETISFTLRPQAYAQKITQKTLSNQVAAAYQGYIVQRYFDQGKEIDVVVRLPDSERMTLANLDRFPIKSPSNNMVPLGSIAKTHYAKGYDVIKQENGQATIHVTASVDTTKNNANQIIMKLQNQSETTLAQTHHVKLLYEGKAKEQRETLNDMKFGLMIAVSLIYIILAAVFSSYTWPLIIMTIIPIGLTGGILGHYFLKIDFTILSLFGFFGLAGIVINDSIILINRYRSLKPHYESVQQAMHEAMKQRLRPVLLTSLTTIVGLMPIIFETSLQAQFLIPMAVTISFGLAYATLLVLFVVPSAMLCYEITCRSSKHDVAQSQSPEIS